MQQEKFKGKVFLCHSSNDKQLVRALNQKLKNDGIKTWLDEDDIYPGMDWQQEIAQAVKFCEIILVCLSNNSTTKTGFVNKEIKYALDRADEQPEGKIYLIPIRLEECSVPDRLNRWQWVDLFMESGYEKLLKSLPISAQHRNDYMTSIARTPEAFRERYQFYKKKFQELILKTFSEDFKIYTNTEIKGCKFDLILNSLDYDYIIDVMYTEGIIPQKYLLDILSNLQKRASLYKQNIKLRTKTRLVFLVTREALLQKGHRDTNLDYKIVGLFNYQNQNLRGSDTTITYFEVQRLDTYAKEDVFEKLKADDITNN